MVVSDREHLHAQVCRRFRDRIPALQSEASKQVAERVLSLEAF